MSRPETVLPLESLNSRIRSRFPMIDRDSLGQPRTYLNTGAGSLTVDTAAEAAREAQGRLNPMPGTVVAGEAATAALHARVRDLVADFLHAGGGAEISFHQSATAALFGLAFGLRGVLGPSANLVVTDLDHMANVSPWETVWGEGRGCEIRRARLTPEGTLDVAHLLSLVDARTGLLAVTSASNGTGSVVRLAEVVAEVRRKAPDCLVAVDAVHHAPHGTLDVAAAGIDFLVFSGYKVFGPMLGVLWGRREHLERLLPYRVETNKPVLPGKLEMGMLNNASLAALEAALEYLLWLAGLCCRPGAPPARHGPRNSASSWRPSPDTRRGSRDGSSKDSSGSRRATCGASASPIRSATAERVPTFAFDAAGLTATETKKRLWQEAAIQIADGNHYSAAVYRHLGRPEGICRASFAHYDNAETVDRFLEAVGRLRG